MEQHHQGRTVTVYSQSSKISSREEEQLESCRNICLQNLQQLSSLYVHRFFTGLFTVVNMTKAQYVLRCAAATKLKTKPPYGFVQIIAFCFLFFFLNTISQMSQNLNKRQMRHEWSRRRVARANSKREIIKNNQNVFILHDS